MRAANLEVLTGDIQRQYGPGVTVWGKGDKPHQSSTSDHNEDDTPGSKSEQQDSDNIPEHRALDIPYQGPFSERDADDLRVKLTTRPANQRRLRYAIQRQTIWRKKGGWKPEHYNGEYHGHLHLSSDVADDDNRAHWAIGDGAVVPSSEGDGEMKIIIANLSGRATLYSGLRGVVPLMAHSHEAALEALDAAGAVRRTFVDAAALVEATGPIEGWSVSESVEAVRAAG